MGKTFLLLDSGSAYTVVCKLFPPMPQSSRHTDAYLVTEHNSDFSIASKRAVDRVYSAIIDRNENISPGVAGFDLAERGEATRNISGQSGGLAFAAAYAQKVKFKEIKSGFDADIAATGVINEDGRVLKVQGVFKKLEAAVGLLGNNGVILYPEENHSQVINSLPEDVTEKIKAKSINLYPVKDICHMLDILFKPENPAGSGKSVREKKKIKGLVLSLLAAVIAIIIVLMFVFYTRPPETVPKVISKKIVISASKKESMKKESTPEELKPVVKTPAPIKKKHEPIIKKSLPEKSTKNKTYEKTEKGFY